MIAIKHYHSSTIRHILINYYIKPIRCCKQSEQNTEHTISESTTSALFADQHTVEHRIGQTETIIHRKDKPVTMRRASVIFTRKAIRIFSCNFRFYRNLHSTQLFMSYIVYY